MELREAWERGALGRRLWLYSNYHCNLECAYCLTSSSPTAPRRLLDGARMIAAAREAAELGFTSVGVTGGEPFLRPDMPDLLASLSEHLPVLVLSNGMLFTERLLERVARLAGRDVTVQLSLDAAEAGRNDALRGEGNHARVVAAIRALRERGVRVRVATTGVPDAEARARLCALHLELGIPDEDHVTRPVVARGRGAGQPGAVATSTENLAAELTLTADGAYWSPFAPTVVGRRVDTDLLVCRVTAPLSRAVEHMLRALGGRASGAREASGIP